eukprot:TRINITY_DN11756_c1_g1_i1.p1 TRINITY_DN11756_c1_g1~~TRINITY_DN11756_c1_g1_i1.p1  ORF type:complete len:651 (-),score=83.37 TRINITY_DN11756_c1_g1_i1:195-2147(-)
MKIVKFDSLSRKRSKQVHWEAELMQRLHHPYIVRFRESFVDETTLSIVMDFAGAGDLRNHIHEAKHSQLAIPEERLVRWVTQAFLGLDYVHSLHILHRDLKSENLFLETTDHLRIGDFGIACSLRQSAKIVVESNLVGTPYYLSPEICTMGVHSKASDVWALGCVLFELAALTVPFHGTDLDSLIREITTKPAPKLPIMYSAELADVYASLMCTSRTQRPLTREVLRCAPMRQTVHVLLPWLNDPEGRKKFVADFECPSAGAITGMSQRNMEFIQGCSPKTSSSRCRQQGANQQSKLEEEPQPELPTTPGHATCCSTVLLPQGPSRSKSHSQGSIHNLTPAEVPNNAGYRPPAAQSRPHTPKVAVGTPVQRLRELKHQKSCSGLPYPASSLQQPAIAPALPPLHLPPRMRQSGMIQQDETPGALEEDLGSAAVCCQKQEQQVDIPAARLSVARGSREINALPPPALSSQISSSSPDKLQMRSANASTCASSTSLGDAREKRPHELPPLHLDLLSRCEPGTHEVRLAVPRLKGLESARSMSVVALSSARRLCRALSGRDRAHSESRNTERLSRQDNSTKQQVRQRVGRLSSRAVRQPFRRVAGGVLPSFAIFAMPLTQRRRCYLDLPRPGQVQTVQTSRSSSAPAVSRRSK